MMNDPRPAAWADRTGPSGRKKEFRSWASPDVPDRGRLGQPDRRLVSGFIVIPNHDGRPDNPVAPTRKAVALGGPLYTGPEVPAVNMAPREGRDTGHRLRHREAGQPDGRVRRGPGADPLRRAADSRGAVQVAGIGPFLQGNINRAVINQGDRSFAVLYSKLSEGQIVGQDEPVAVMDPSRAVPGRQGEVRQV